MAQLLDDAAIEVALVLLPEWHRVDNAIARDVAVDAAAGADLEASVAAVADELNHHPVVDRSGDGVTFKVWTHSAGGVTTKDIELARRIDGVISGAV